MHYACSRFAVLVEIVRPEIGKSLELLLRHGK
jgi:hypothetical protein